ncbi:TIGR04211 family SH3 domain-containing protein [Kangiella sp. HZ709]|uniref:TIGR04211 family SH3 domain-containing protein n=1 Tax=Kangiella sp. HZ709 TaxID=2666328 RepID=UPI0012B15122|nr:TIGR04211 family SH3 domain-containing protein [Kangiella sp. HZ709]MRX28643.1 TIGR04211 family SH3 domain-containing protein [Kangiella sp. HZ709]
MPRFLLFFIFIGSLLLSSNITLAAADETTGTFVSDEIGVTMRSGPTNRYRVIGSLRAGTPITVLQQDADNDTTEVRTVDGKTTGWIKTEYVSNKTTVLAQYQSLQTETSKLQSQVVRLTQDLNNKNAITKQNEELQLKVSELENHVDQLSQKADLQKSRFRKDVFYAGALTVFISMLIAWLITRTIYSRRQSSGWR